MRTSSVSPAGPDASSLEKLSAETRKRRRKLLLRRLLSNRLALFGGFVVFLVVAVSLLVPLLLAYDPYQTEVTDRLLPPGGAHWLGTDNFGRDLLSRVAYGARLSLGIGFSVAFCASLFGLVVGLYASYYPALEHVLMRVCDGLMAFPSILLAMACMAALGPRTENIVICLSLVLAPTTARLICSAALVAREQTYIEAIRAAGASAQRIIWRHIAPNVLSPLIVQATFIFAESIIVEAALSFLGVGVPAPAPSMGNLLNDGKTVIFKAWWMTVFPGVTIILCVLGLNMLGDGLRDFLDPHAKTKSKG